MANTKIRQLKIKDSTYDVALPNDQIDKLIIGTGTLSSNGSIAGGTTDKSLVSGILGPVAAAITSLSAANAGGTMSMAYGANCNTYAPGTMAIGMNISAGCKGYYFDSINFNSKLSDGKTPCAEITLSSTRRVSSAFSVNYPSSTGWAKDDVITIFNEGCYPCCATILETNEEDTTLAKYKIKVSVLPFTSIAYKGITVLGVTTYTYDMPHDRTVVNNSKPNAGVVELGFASVAMGGGYNNTNQANRATGLLSYAFGYGNLSAGNFSTTFGRENKAGQCALAIGQNCSALGTHSFAGGHNSETSVTANKGFAFGGEAKAQNDYAVAFGLRSYATGYNAFSNGVDTTASGRHAVAFGEEGIASGRCSLFIGSIPGDGTACNGPDNTTTFTPKGATGGYSVAIGQMNSATNTGSVAIGAKNQSTATYSFVTGYRNLANSNAKNAFISGKQNAVNGPWSITGGANNTNNGEGSIVVGTGIINSSAINSALFGYGHTGTGNRNLIAGTSNTVSAGHNVVLLGNNLIGNSSNVNRTSQVVIGQYNKKPSTSDIFVVGTGSSTSSLNNTLTVRNEAVIVNGRINATTISSTNLYASSFSPSNLKFENNYNGYTWGWNFKTNSDYSDGISSGNLSLTINQDWHEVIEGSTPGETYSIETLRIGHDGNLDYFPDTNTLHIEKNNVHVGLDSTLRTGTLFVEREAQINAPLKVHNHLEVLGYDSTSTNEGSVASTINGGLNVHGKLNLSGDLQVHGNTTMSNLQANHLGVNSLEALTDISARGSINAQLSMSTTAFTSTTATINGSTYLNELIVANDMLVVGEGGCSAPNGLNTSNLHTTQLQLDNYTISNNMLYALLNSGLTNEVTINNSFYIYTIGMNWNDFLWKSSSFKNMYQTTSDGYIQIKFTENNKYYTLYTLELADDKKVPVKANDIVKGNIEYFIDFPEVYSLNVISYYHDEQNDDGTYSHSSESKNYSFYGDDTWTEFLAKYDDVFSVDSGDELSYSDWSTSGMGPCYYGYQLRKEDDTSGETVQVINYTDKVIKTLSDSFNDDYEIILYCPHDTGC